ncbi:hypothetical protein GCM10027056_25080 [Glaciibacter psychrotolerans]
MVGLSRRGNDNGVAVGQIGEFRNPCRSEACGSCATDIFAWVNEKSEFSPV